MTPSDDRSDDDTTDRRTAYEAQERAFSSEGRRLSVWALVAAVAFVVAMVALAFGVWTGGGTSPAPRIPPGATSPNEAPPPSQNIN